MEEPRGKIGIYTQSGHKLRFFKGGNVQLVTVGIIIICKEQPNAYSIHVLWHHYRMYFADNKQLHVPHIHAEYAEEKSVFGIVDGAILAGKFTNNKARLVQAWIEIHREELNANWQLSVNGEEVFKIEPLK